MLYLLAESEEHNQSIEFDDETEVILLVSPRTHSNHTSYGKLNKDVNKQILRYVMQRLFELEYYIASNCATERPYELVLFDHRNDLLVQWLAEITRDILTVPNVISKILPLEKKVTDDSALELLKWYDKFYSVHMKT